MIKYDVQLVVPKIYLKSFPSQFQDKILTLDTFLKFVASTQG
ncbi:MAG: hypothetical protein ISS19_04530 [Bacteroidales bacterium]|nr:hypothetical protein [Bacteroidales bacterium]